MPQPLPGLDCPLAPDADPATIDDLNSRLTAWMRGLDIPANDRQRLADADCGAFAALAFTNAADQAHLTVGAKWLATITIIDDYCDRPARNGGRPAQWLEAELLGLDRAGRVFTPPHPRAETPPLRMLRSARLAVDAAYGVELADRLGRAAATTLHRHTIEALWRATGYTPTVDEYLLSLQSGAYRIAIDLIDIVGGYPLPASVTAHTAMRRIVRTSAQAMDLLNDCYSARWEPAGHVNAITCLAAERHTTTDNALQGAIKLHNQAMRDCDSACTDLSTYRLPEPDAQQRFIDDLRAWMAGNHAWHLHTVRYHTDHGGTP